MWVPECIDELERAVRAGSLVEGPGLDVKAALPDPKRNAHLAVDVAAMTVDGGVLIYGVAETGGTPTALSPIELAGARERVDQIVQTSIAEPPFIETRTLPSAKDPARGALVVVIPQSPRAPHQITARGRYFGRFYGRGDTGNRVLTEGEVARLYQRRGQWDEDAQRLLAQCIAQGPPPHENFGYLHAFVQPVALQDDLWARLDPNQDMLPDVFKQIGEAANKTGPNAGYSPQLKATHGWRRRGADVWTLEGYGEPGPNHVRCDLNLDGRAYLFVGRAAERRERRPDQEAPLMLFEQLIAGNFASFLAIVGAYYSRGGYRGMVDVGVAVTGIHGAISVRLMHALDFHLSGYDAPTFTRTTRAAAGELLKPEPLAGRMLRRLMDAVAGPAFDPFA